MKKTISILGSTGSIGHSVLSIISKKKNLFTINYLTANNNYKLISQQIKKFNPKIFIINNDKVFKKIKKKSSKIVKLKFLEIFKIINLSKVILLFQLYQA